MSGPKICETVRFVYVFNRFFDCFNVSNFTDGKYKRKVFQQPYRSGNDFRLNATCTYFLFYIPWCDFMFSSQFLESEFLPYLDSWEESVQGKFQDNERKRMLLSSETMLGIRITSELSYYYYTKLCCLVVIAHSFIELVRYILILPGVKAFLSRKICQDPVEKFF